MKKFFAAVLIALAVVVGQIAFPTSCAAIDSYVGTFRVSQAKAYILTETVKRTDSNTCKATLKAVFPNGEVQFIYYVFENGYGGVYFRNSDGNSGRISSDRTPIEYNMYAHYVKWCR